MRGWVGDGADITLTGAGKKGRQVDMDIRPGDQFFRVGHESMIVRVIKEIDARQTPRGPERQWRVRVVGGDMAGQETTCDGLAHSEHWRRVTKSYGRITQTEVSNDGRIWAALEPGAGTRAFRWKRTTYESGAVITETPRIPVACHATDAITLGEAEPIVPKAGPPVPTFKFTDDTALGCTHVTPMIVDTPARDPYADLRDAGRMVRNAAIHDRHTDAIVSALRAPWRR